jgi:hypothetical protein
VPIIWMESRMMLRIRKVGEIVTPAVSQRLNFPITFMPGPLKPW